MMHPRRGVSLSNTLTCVGAKMTIIVPCPREKFYQRIFREVVAKSLPIQANTKTVP
jgi:hypothetical protein